jgi:hypothetical protein
MVNKYRIWCATESNFFYVWSDGAEVKCPNDGSHSIDSNSVTLLESTEVTLAVSSEKYITPIYHQQSISSLSDIITVGTSNMQVTSNTILSCAGPGKMNVSTNFKSYVDSALAGITLSTSNLQSARWGLFDSSNGFYFQAVSPSNVLCCSMANGSSNIYQGQIIETTNMNDYTIAFSRNTVTFSVSDNIITSSYIPPSQLPTSILPLSIECSSSSNNNTAIITVKDRYIKVQPDVDLKLLQSSWRLMSIELKEPVPPKGVYTPLVSFRRNTDKSPQVLVLDSIDIITKSDVILEISIGGTLRGPTAFVGVNSNNSVVEYDTSSTSYTGGTRVWYGYAASLEKTMIKNLDILFNDVQLTISGQALSSASGSINISPRWKESW